MTSAYACAFALVTATATGCVIDKSLGDPDDTMTASSSDSTGTADGGPGDGGSLSASSGISTDSTGTPAPTGEMTLSGTATMGDGGSVCDDWAGPPFNCELPGDAIARIYAEQLPPMNAEICNVAGIVAESPEVDVVTLACAADMHELRIESAAPHHDVSYLNGLEVAVTFAEPIYQNDTTAPSLALHSTDGESPELLLLWVNTYDVDAEIDIDISPLSLTISGSGCPATNAAETCDADGSILMQRAILTFGDNRSFTALQDGAQGITTGNGNDYSVTVDIAERRVCWDDDCVIDDSGPFERFSFLVTRLPMA